VANFTFSSDKLTWGAARVACKKLGMDLATVETEMEHKCIFDRLELMGSSLLLLSNAVFFCYLLKLCVEFAYY
jgi:hypothetical protein